MPGTMQIRLTWPPHMTSQAEHMGHMSQAITNALLKGRWHLLVTGACITGCYAHPAYNAPVLSVAVSLAIVA